APDAFDICADRGSHRPLTFGAGVHYCLGANLARAELQEALAFLAPRLPGLRLDGEPVYGSINGVSALDDVGAERAGDVGASGERLDARVLGAQAVGVGLDASPHGDDSLDPLPL